MKIVIVFFLLLTGSLLSSCNKKKPEEFFTLEEFHQLAHETKETYEKNDGLNISDYSPGVKAKEAQTLVYKRLIFYAVPFETQEQARKEAIRLNQYYARNWLFDRVEGEPVLEDYVIETFKAINPNRKIQRVPQKKTEEGHHDDHHKEEAAPHH